MQEELHLGKVPRRYRSVPLISQNKVIKFTGSPPSGDFFYLRNFFVRKFILLCIFKEDKSGGITMNMKCSRVFKKALPLALLSATFAMVACDFGSDSKESCECDRPSETPKDSVVNDSGVPTNTETVDGKTFLNRDLRRVCDRLMKVHRACSRQMKVRRVFRLSLKVRQVLRRA